MKNLFVNPVFDFINTLCNYVVLNLLFLITCLPVITIGTALSSLYYVTLKEARGEYGYLVRTYLREFRKNLKSGTAAFAVLFFTGALLLFNVSFWFSMNSLLTSVIAAIMLIACIVWFLVFSYTFPLIGRFENTTKQTLHNAFCLMMSNVKYTLAILFMDAFVFFFCMFLPSFMKIFMLLLGFAFTACCQSFIFNKVFEPYENTKKGGL